MEKIKLDLVPSGKMPSLHASQYDDGREHGIDLFENGVVYKLDGTETLTINERKGDDCICSLDVENTFADSNHIVFASTEQMCAVWGNNICELVIAKGEKTIGTLNFILEIEHSPTEDGIESESEIKNLKRQIEAITEEVIGDDYYTKTQTDNAIATAVEGKADKTDTYTKTQVDTALNDKADVTDLPDMSQYYDKSEVDDLLDDKADADNTYTKEQVDDIAYNIMPDDTASGSVANFTTSLELPIKSLEVDVNAVQDLHGQENPYPAGGGKNLIDNSDFFTYSSWETDLVTVGEFPTSISNRGYALPTISGETYTISFGIDASNIPPYVYLCKSDGETSTRVAYITTGSSLFNRTYTFTSDGSLYYLRSGSMSNESSFNTQIGKISYVQLEKGSTATEYAPYENICPIEGWSDISLVKCGANLCDEVFEIGSIDNQTGQNANNPNYCRSKNYIQVPKGENLYLVNGNSDTLGLRFYDSNKAFIGARAFLTSKVMPYGTYDLPTGTAYIRIVNTSTNVYANNISLNYPSTDTAYHAHNGNTEVINLGGTYYGGHFTQGKAGHRQLVVTYSELLDMGTLDWRGFDVQNNVFRANVLNCKLPVDNADRRNGFLCSIYPPSSSVSLNANMTDKSLLRYNGWIVLRDTSFSNYTEIASAVSGQKLIYELAEPIIIDLPDGEPIITLTGTNNIFADTGDCAVEYKCSVAEYVANHSGGSGAKSLGGVFLGGSNSGSEEEPTEESEEPKDVTKTLGDEPISKK